MNHEHNDADDSTAESERFLDRRDYLKATGASAVAFAGGIGSTGTVAAAPTNTGSVSGSGYSTTDHGDYVEVTVGQDGQWVCSLGDGDTLSNYLIDITATNANAQINPSGGGWTVENVGFKGISDDAGNYPKKHVAPLVTSGATGTIRHLYMGDGAVTDSRKGAIWVDPDHAGELLIQEAYIAGWADNGLYGSAPGNGPNHTNPGNGGTVKVSDSYSADNETSNFRLGTTGSYLDNCVMEGGSHRSYWGYYEDTELRNCDVTGAPIVVGEDAHEKGKTATVTADNCRYDVDVVLATSTNEFSGSSQGTPDATPPDCVPTTPEEAAKGSGCGSSTEGVIDDFEDGDLSEYAFEAGSSYANVVSSPTHSGSYALEFADASPGAISTSGLNAYPSAGDTFSYWVRASGGADNLNVTWGVQDHDNRYYAKLKPSSGEFYLFTYENGNGQSHSNEHHLSLSQDTWYEIEIQWATDGTQTAVLYDAGGTQLARISMTDSTWSSGGVGYDAYLSSGESVYFDDVRFESSATVVEDFEDGDLSEYSGNTGGYRVQSSTVLEGSRSLEATSTYAQIARTDVTTERGHEYRCRIEAGSGTGAEPSLLACVQDASDPLRDCYWAFPDVSAGEFKLIRRDGDSSTVLDSVTYTLQEATQYELALELATDTVKAVLYDSSGSVAAETTAVSDSTYSGGGVGFYTGGGTPGYYDYVTKTPL
ncbi:hypothetical protein [Halorussus sp. MSC15.2]|uniref:hypothetical protein n=1 Tax=Halorussus sp. MSC15.2 TaxID=2283638 RepID=UPI0013D220D1|nr:hypothetical protein [Halorussus sp. MSC15.2]NEU56786.1 hypothetical protein [Halorussus sp. MSC15.2]